MTTLLIILLGYIVLLVVLSRLGTVGKTEINKVYESKVQSMIQFSDCLAA